MSAAADSAHDPPTLVSLLGAPAIGKMTVGEALCRRTGYQLFYSHHLADVLAPFFPVGTPAHHHLAQTWRRTFVEAAVHAGLNLVMTTAWRFDVPHDAETLWGWFTPYVSGGGRVLCVELVAPLAVRLARHHTKHRQRSKHQPWVTDDYLRETDRAHRYDSGGAFPFDLPHLRLETEHLAAEATAHRIIDHFGLPQLTPTMEASQ